MRYIEKKEEPDAFVKWKTDYQHQINQLFAKYNDKENTEITKSDQVWSLLRKENLDNPEFSKPDLRRLLIDEQGGRVIREKVRNLANVLIKSDPHRFKMIKNQKLEQLYANPQQYEKMAFVHEYSWNTYA